MAYEEKIDTIKSVAPISKKLYDAVKTIVSECHKHADCADCPLNNGCKNRGGACPFKLERYEVDLYSVPTTELDWCNAPGGYHGLSALYDNGFKNIANIKWELDRGGAVHLANVCDGIGLKTAYKIEKLVEKYVKEMESKYHGG